MKTIEDMLLDEKRNMFLSLVENEGYSPVAAIQVVDMLMEISFERMNKLFKEEYPEYYKDIETNGR